MERGTVMLSVVEAEGGGGLTVDTNSPAEHGDVGPDRGGR